MKSRLLTSKRELGETFADDNIDENIFGELPRMSTGARIHIVDDDEALGKFLSRELARNNFIVDVSRDGETACEVLRRSDRNLLILDLNLPGLDGMDVLKQARLIQPQLPILVLTARSRTEDMVMALERGADDCLIKPFSFKELLARVRSLLRRKYASPVSLSKVGDLTINREERWVVRNERRIELTPREFALLDYLMNNAGKTVSRMTLMEDVWNTPFDSNTNIVDVYMKYLRDKVDGEGEVRLIRTVRGVGYVLTDD